MGPQVGKDLQRQAIYAVLFGLVGILLYVAIRFDVKGAVAAVIAVFHDIVICLGALSVTQREISLPVPPPCSRSSAMRSTTPSWPMTVYVRTGARSFREGRRLRSK